MMKKTSFTSFPGTKKTRTVLQSSPKFTMVTNKKRKSKGTNTQISKIRSAPYNQISNFRFKPRLPVHEVWSRCDLFRTAHYLACVFARFESEIWILNVLDAPYFGCLFVGHPFFWMARWWTLEMTASSFSPSFRMETTWIMPFHHGKGVSCFETKRKHPFWWFLAHQWWFCTIQHYKDHFQSWKSTILLIFTCSIHCPSSFEIILAFKFWILIL
jgi:hypothetical protein